jgi:SAM-dependent methyltransferase
MRPFKQKPAAYLTTEPRYKDYYGWAIESLQEHNCKVVVDFGCATGDFLYFLPETKTGIGLDKSKELISFAKKNRQKPNLEFILTDFLKRNSFPRDFPKDLEIDAATIFGTITTIKQIDHLFFNLDLYQPKLLLINDYFNPHPVDVSVTHREIVDTKYESAFNIYSVSTIKSLLTLKGYVDIHIQSYYPNIKINRTDDVLRSYSSLLDEQPVMTNGTGMVFHGFSISARRK